MKNLGFEKRHARKMIFVALMLPLAAAAQEADSTVVGAQSISALWQQMPDEVVPVLSKINRLDMIDFRENNMEARVSNIMGGNSVMDTLTCDYLHVTLSPQTALEMKLLPDGRVVVVNTAAALSSTISVYNAEWQQTGTMQMPAVADFLPADVAPTLLNALAAVPLITAALSPADDSVTFTLHPDELSRDDRKEAVTLLHTVSVKME